MSKIKIHTTPPSDQYEQVVVRGDMGRPIIRQYGEAKGEPYILCSELNSLLRQHQPRTDEDRVNFLEDSHRLVNVTFVGTRWYVLVDGENMFAAHTNFRSWREAMDAWMDQEEEV